MNKIGLYGAGKNGQDLAGILKEFDLLRCFIDGDEKKQKSGVEGVEVFGIDDFIERYPDDKIVVASTQYDKQIVDELSERGKKNGEDFWNYYEFKGPILHRLLLDSFNVLYVELAQICVTERCTLKCKKCAHACNLVPMNREDMSLEEIKYSADCFFSIVDMVGEFVLIGGEPLLNKRLADAVDYIGEKYRGKMLTFAITTNGTIIPDKRLKDSCYKYGVKIRVSDYSDTLPHLASKYKKLYEETQEMDVSIWKTNSYDAWFDYGFTETDNGDNPSILKSIFSDCKTPCREIRGEKYYYCVMARCICDNMSISVENHDYFEINKNTCKEDFLEFELYGPHKGYLDMCRYCRGASAINYRIPAAEQE